MGAEITVLTAMPNYPQMEIHEGYKGKLYSYEEIEGLKIHRSYIFTNRSRSIVFRLFNYFSFVFSSFFAGIIKTKKHDFILCESPPLFLGISAWLLTKFKGAGLIFNVSDLWPESAEKLGLVTNKFFLGISTKLEEFLYRKSVLITGQTNGIVKNIAGRFPHKKIYWLPNGVDLDFFNSVDSNKGETWRSKNNFPESDLLFLYAGIIGHAQGLEVIIKAAGRLKEHGNIKFILLGSGPEKEKLQLLKHELKLENVFFYDALPKSQMPDIIRSMDAAIIPLKKLDLFKGAIPSKIFETLAMKKPILLGVEGEAHELFIEKGKSGLAFTPENEEDLARIILQLKHHPEQLEVLGNNGYDYVKENFSRDMIASAFWNFLNGNFR